MVVDCSTTFQASASTMAKAEKQVYLQSRYEMALPCAQSAASVAEAS